MFARERRGVTTNASALLELISIFKLVNSLTLIAVGVGALRLLHNNGALSLLTEIAGRFGFNPGSRHFDRALDKRASLLTN